MSIVAAAWTYLDTGEIYVEDDAGFADFDKMVASLPEPDDAIGCLIAAAPRLMSAARAFVAPYAEVTDAQLQVSSELGIKRTTRGEIHIPIAPEVAMAVLSFRAAIARGEAA